MPHYNTVKEEREAIEQFQTLTEEKVKPAVQSLKDAATQLEFKNRRDALRDSDLIREWQAMFGTFRGAHEVANLDAATNIAQEVSDAMREAVEYSKDLAVASAPAAGGKRRKYSRKYCKKTPCRKMGFTQKASCRPYKNCFTRRKSKGY
jgi:hypothetical protein